MQLDVQGVQGVVYGRHAAIDRRGGRGCAGLLETLPRPPVLTGYKRSSRDTYIQRLRQLSLVDVAGDRVLATAEGVAALGPAFEPLPTGPALQEYWLTRLPEGERKILEMLIAGYPDAVDRDLLSEQTGYKRSSRDTYLQRLSSRRLVESVGRGAVRASGDLF